MRAVITWPFRVALQKADRSRLYRIDRAQGAYWRGEVYFGTTVHRSLVVPTAAAAHRLRVQFQREIDALRLDGWTIW